MQFGLFALQLPAVFPDARFSTQAAKPEIVSVARILERAEHNAFADLIRFCYFWWCAFREGESHESSVADVRIIVSSDGVTWRAAVFVTQDGIDLRDPKLSVTSDDRVMLIVDGTVYDDKGTYQTRSPQVAFSNDGYNWSEPKKLLAENHWLWRVTWHNGWANAEIRGEGCCTAVVVLNWQWIAEFRLPNNNTWKASETTLRFLPDGEMVALTRPDWLGTNCPPYREWSWTKMKERIGGPNFIRLPDGSLWAARRRSGEKATTVLARMTRDSYQPVLTLPSGGDCSYSDMVWYDGLPWMSYYASHEGKTCIYLAKILVSSTLCRTPRLIGVCS